MGLSCPCAGHAWHAWGVRHRCKGGHRIRQGPCCRALPPPQVYGVGEESGAELTHAVVELLFTTSIE